MLKLMGLLLLFSSAVLAGFWAAGELEAQERLLRRLIAYFRQFSLQLQCLRASPAQIARRLSAQREFSTEHFLAVLGQGFDQSESFSAALVAALSLCPEVTKTGLDEILLPLGEVIGVQELESQLATLASAVLLLEQRQTIARERSTKTGGLYRRLGVLAGVLLTVIFF